MGKLAVAAYAVFMINIVGALLQPGRAYLESLCRVLEEPQPTAVVEEEPQKEESTLPSIPLEKKVSFPDDSSPASSPARGATKIATGSYREVGSPSKKQQ